MRGKQLANETSNVHLTFDSLSALPLSIVWSVVASHGEDAVLSRPAAVTSEKARRNQATLHKSSLELARAEPCSQ